MIHFGCPLLTHIPIKWNGRRRNDHQKGPALCDAGSPILIEVFNKREDIGDMVPFQALTWVFVNQSAKNALTWIVEVKTPGLSWIAQKSHEITSQQWGLCKKVWRRAWANFLCVRPQTWDSPVVAGRDATAAGGAQKFPQVFGVSFILMAVGGGKKIRCIDMTYTLHIYIYTYWHILFGSKRCSLFMFNRWRRLSSFGVAIGRQPKGFSPHSRHHH